MIQKASIAPSPANMSEGYFCRFFKRVMRKTPTEYVNCYRVHKATALLENGDGKVLDIAMDTGFESLGHFIRIFKKHYSLTPSDYRRRYGHRRTD